MGDFAQQIAIAYRIGTARGERSQLSRLGVGSDDFFALFGRSINSLILSHRENLEAKLIQPRVLARGEPVVNSSSFQITRSTSDSKQRWVDGTPEYSFSVCALRKLFPDARFIHVVRNVEEVVSSMLHFERVAGTKLVSCAREGYQYWMHSVRACLAAEQAYGPGVVHRLYHHELTREPQRSLGSVLDFVGEPFSASCVEPLAERINSSRVGSHSSEHSDSDTDIRSEAMFLLALHLSHGSSSFFQSLGLNNQKLAPRLAWTGRIFAWLLFVGYSSIPAAVLLGWVKLRTHS